MSAAYWAQWNHSEIVSMHGIELDQPQDTDNDFECDNLENDDEDSCPMCTGGGCNYCLMVDW